MLTFEELWEKLLAGDESVSIEVKYGRAVGKAVVETVSSFSNEPGQEGGYLMLGIEQRLSGGKHNLFEPSYVVVGVPNAAQLQDDLVTRCRNDMDPPVSPQTAIRLVDDKKVLLAYIPEAETHAKPVYIKAKGVQNGSFRRIGGSDIKCTAEDIEEFFAARKGRSYDQSVVADAILDDIDPKAVAEYRRLRKEIKPDAPELAEEDEELLLALGALRRENGQHKVTLTGVVLFAKAAALRRLCPAHRVDYIHVPGREWVQDPEHRYVAVDYLEPLVLAISRVVGQVFGDLPKAFSLPEGALHRKDIPAIPYRVLREAVVNAVMHRSYRVREPIQIIRYANRIEIRSPGYSLVPEDRLGTPGSRTRNEYIAAVLRDLNFAETKGTGIKTMRALMREANLSAPAFASDRVRDHFTVTLLAHHLLGEADVAWLGSFKDLGLDDDDAKALIAMRELGSLSNSLYRDISGVDTLTASKGLQRLTRHELLERQGQGSATYYVPGRRFVNSLPSPAGERTPQHQRVNPPILGGNPPTSPETGTGGDETLPADLRERLEKIRKYAKAEEVKSVIEALCAVRPFRVSELEVLLNKRDKYLLSKFLRPMLDAGILQYLYADEPSHPKQAYRTTSSKQATKKGK